SNDSTRGAGDSNGAPDTVPAGPLDRATAAVRASAAAVTPSARSLRAMLDALEAMERGQARERAQRRQVMRSGKGDLSLTEDSLMRKWRFHDAFRPLSFESLERRRLLAAVSEYQDDDGADRRPVWPDS